jgi:hypothetical protein
MRGVIFVVLLAVVAIGVYVVFRRYTSRAPIPNEALLHMRVPRTKRSGAPRPHSRGFGNGRALTVDSPGLRVCVTTGAHLLNAFGEEVCVVVRAWNDGSALTVRSDPRYVPLLFDDGTSSRNVRRVAEVLVDEGAALVDPL